MIPYDGYLSMQPFRIYISPFSHSWDALLGITEGSYTDRVVWYADPPRDRRKCLTIQRAIRIHVTTKNQSDCNEYSRDNPRRPRDPFPVIVDKMW